MLLHAVCKSLVIAAPFAGDAQQLAEAPLPVADFEQLDAYARHTEE